MNRRNLIKSGVLAGIAAFITKSGSPYLVDYHNYYYDLMVNYAGEDVFKDWSHDWTLNVMEMDHNKNFLPKEIMSRIDIKVKSGIECINCWEFNKINEDMIKFKIVKTDKKMYDIKNLGIKRVDSLYNEAVEKSPILTYQELKSKFI